jgi:hypothetical protein
MAYDKDMFKKLANVIGTPEENSIWMVKEVLKDMGLSCSKCGQAYRSPEDQERLGLSIIDRDGLQNKDPGKLRVSVGCCGCGHLGEISLRPNPLIVSGARGYNVQTV